MMYQLNLRSVGIRSHHQHFAADDDSTAAAIAGLVFHSTTDHWDSYDLWEGPRLVTNTIAEKSDQLPDHVERAAIAIEETLRALDRFAADKKLLARLNELHARQPQHRSRVDRKSLAAILAKAEQRVAEGEARIERQRLIVAELEHNGHDTMRAREVLRTVEALQVEHVSIRDGLRQDLAAAKD